MNINPMQAAPRCARRNQSEQDSVVVRLRSRAGRSAECMVLAVAHLKAKGTATTSTALGRRK